VRERRLGAIARAVRRRQGLRQSDLAAAAGLSRSIISRLEGGNADRLTIQMVRQAVEPLGMRIELRATWRGPELDRLLDEQHAALQAGWAGRLAGWGWQTWPEVSYSRYGERGRVDLVAWDPALGVLLIIECKSALGDVQATIGALDAKARLGRYVAQQLGLPAPSAVVPVLVFLESMTTRRHLAALEPLFGRYALRGRKAVSWLQRPEITGLSAPTGLLIFSAVHQEDLRGPIQRRVRRRRDS
jgi:transcriptional regulator with XRE-family HTH domain